MKRSRPSPLLLCYFLLVLASQVSAQQIGQIAGELHVIRGDFPGRVLVELQFRGAPITSQYTDEEGKFVFGGLTDNVYHVVVHDDHYYPVDERVMLDLSVTSVAIVQINLTPRSPATTKDTLQSEKGSNPFIVDTEEYRRKFPKKAVKEFDKGVESDQRGKADDAIRHYEKSLQLAPDFYPAHNNLGSDYLSKADFAKAQVQFEQAIKLNQSDPQARLNLANLFLATKNYPAAFDNVQEGLRRNPNSAFGEFLLGSIEERLGKLIDAERALRAALGIDPGMSRVHLELVNIYLAQNQKPKAAGELKAFLQSAPNDTLAPKAKKLLTQLEAAQ